MWWDCRWVSGCYFNLFVHGRIVECIEGTEFDDVRCLGDEVLDVEGFQVSGL